jgi:hypothetical protein
LIVFSSRKAKLSHEKSQQDSLFVLDEEFPVYPMAVQNQGTLWRANVFSTRNPQKRW